MLILKRYTRSNPIATKLLAHVLLCSSLITLIAIGIQLYIHFDQDVDDLTKRLNQIHASSVPSITKSLWAFDMEQLELQIEGILKLNDIIKVNVRWKDWDGTEQSIEHTQKSLTEAQNSLNIRTITKVFPLEYREKTTSEVRTLGTIEIIASMEGIFQRVREQATIIALQQGLKTILISLVILLLVRRLITRHLEHIASYARTSTLDNLTKPLALNRSPQKKEDELDNVVNGFNQMRTSLLEDMKKRKETELALEREQLAKSISEQRQKDAEESNRAKSQFLATMSHEIRTPMNGVIGMIEILRHSELNETQVKQLNVIQRSGEALIALINDILDYSKIEARKMELEQTAFDLEELISDCLQLFASEANKKSIAFTGGVLPNTPTQLIGDPMRLRQLLTNLMGNAFKFTEQGHIILRVYAEQRNANDSVTLHFAISDSGIGVDSSQAQKLFSPFTQADNTTTRKYGGTGLGLTICKSLAELMNGEIGVKSCGIGSTFWFTAQFMLASATQPVSQASGATLIISENSKYCDFYNQYHQHNIEAFSFNLLHQSMEAVIQKIKSKPYTWVIFDIDVFQQPAELKAMAAQNTESCKIIPFAFKDDPTQMQLLVQHSWPHILPKPLSPQLLFLELNKLRPFSQQTLSPLVKTNAASPINHITQVLVVEDNAVNQMVVCGLLKKFNIHSQVAENGEIALKEYKRNQNYDAILMDCEMPVMDGLECTKKFENLSKPIIWKPLPSSP